VDTDAAADDDDDDENAIEDEKQPESNVDVKKEETKDFVPSARANALVAVKNNMLFLYGGYREEGEREFTLCDMYSLDLGKLDCWNVLIEQKGNHEWIYQNDDDDEDDDDDDEDEGEHEDDDSSSSAGNESDNEEEVLSRQLEGKAKVAVAKGEKADPPAPAVKKAVTKQKTKPPAEKVAKK